jgi:hypothetical protein
MKKWQKWIGGAAVAAFGALQFTNPPHDNPPVVAGQDALASNSPPASVAQTLKDSCYDCHSFETKWRWYSYIAPVSWTIADDVKAGRASLNFSEWPYGDARRARKRWRHIAEEVQNGEMPIRSYTWMHPRARLDARQRADLSPWAEDQVNK